MNFLYKCFLAVCLIGLTFSSFAQDLVHKIPSDALAVATIKGKNLTELMSLTEFNRSTIGKEILLKISNHAEKPLETVEALGLNLSASSYYFNRSNDSVTYNCFLTPVKNAAQLDNLYNRLDKQFAVKGALRSYYNADSTEVAHWNNEMLLFVTAKGKNDYFLRPDVIERYQLTVLTPAEETIDSVAVTDAAVETAEAVEAAEAAEIVKNSVLTDTVAVDTAAIETEDLGVADADNSFFRNEKQKKAIVAGWIQRMVDDFFAATSTTSILNNKDFVKSLDEQAEATIWISGVDKLFNTYMPLSYLKGMSFLNGYGSGSAKLYLEDKTIRIATSMTFSDEIAAVFKRVHQRKLNKRFLKYVNEDRMIGYMGYAIDTKTYLEEYPKLMSKIYGSVYAEEIGMAADLFSLLLDEAAIAKVIKGDGLFIFNGLSQNEVSYKSFEYNEENFETKEVTKTKKETLPDFLLMISSEDTRLLDKLIAYGVKKELVKQSAGYYELSIPKSPLALYFAIKDNIIFFGTNKKEMDDVVSNRYVARVSARHKKTLLGTNYAAYFSAKKLAGKIPADELAGGKKLEKVNGVLNALGDFYLQSNAIQGNVFSGQLSMDIPANQPNALKYLFSIIENAQK